MEEETTVIPVNIRSFEQDVSGRLKALMDLPPSGYIKDAAKVFDPTQALEIGLNFAGVTTQQSPYPALGTTGLTSSMAVIAHNPVTQATGLAHITHEGRLEALSATGEDALREMLTKVGGQNIQVRLVGPQLRGPVVDGFINDVLDVLAQYDAQVVSADFRGKESPHSVAVHAGLWNQGLVRGALSVFNHSAGAIKQGGEMKRRLSEVVPLKGMVKMPHATNSRIVYNGANAEQSAPEPALP